MIHVLLDLDEPTESARTVGAWDWPNLLDTPNLTGVSVFDSLEELRAEVMATPRYPHDCDICKLVGQLGDYDIYIHEGDVVARNGPDGSYLSLDGEPARVLGNVWRGIARKEVES